MMQEIVIASFVSLLIGLIFLGVFIMSGVSFDLINGKRSIKYTDILLALLFFPSTIIVSVFALFFVYQVKKDEKTQEQERLH